MLQKLQTRPIAWLITAVIVVLAIFGGASRSLRMASDNAQRLFVTVRGSDMKGIQYDLGQIIADSNNLLTVAGGYLEPNHIAMDELRRSISALERGDDPAEKYAAAQALRQAAEELDRQLADEALDATAESYRRKLAANIASHYKIMESSGYNAAATYFNRELNSFPANLIAPVVGVGPLELFA